MRSDRCRVYREAAAKSHSIPSSFPDLGGEQELADTFKSPKLSFGQCWSHWIQGHVWPACLCFIKYLHLAQWEWLMLAARDSLGEHLHRVSASYIPELGPFPLEIKTLASDFTFSSHLIPAMVNFLDYSASNHSKALQTQTP